MNEPIKSPAAPAPSPKPPLEYGKADSILFQAWLALFLMVICFALISYLISYIPAK
jgi:hypothetical protein